jgi:hypothetical protein
MVSAFFVVWKFMLRVCSSCCPVHWRKWDLQEFLFIMNGYIYQTFLSKISYLYLHVWVFCLSNCLLQIFMYIFGSSFFNMQCAYSQFCIHVLKNHFPNGLISYTYTNMIKCPTPLSMFFTITFCMTFFHHPSWHNLSIDVFKKHFPNGCISYTYSHMIKCSNPLSMISTIIFCTTWFSPRFL